MTIKKDLNKLKQFCLHLNIQPSTDTFDNRIKLQKVIYLLKQFGLNLPYRFSFYKHGPYSPYLADIYYQIENYDDIVREDSFQIENSDIEKLNRAKKFLEPLVNDSEKLEFYASIAFIFNDMVFVYQEKSESVCIEKIKILKLELVEKYNLEKAISYLKSYDLIDY